MWTYRRWFDPTDDPEWEDAYRQAFRKLMDERIRGNTRRLNEYLLTGTPPDPTPQPAPPPKPLPERLETRPPVPRIFITTFDADELRPQPERKT
jgi:hypothetical protein